MSEDGGAIEREFCDQCAQDLSVLSSLHLNELSRDDLEALSRMPFADRLGLVLDSSQARAGLGLIDEGLTEVAGLGAARALDLLAADYAAIYLTHQHRSSPLESVWLDDDHLMLQRPMFEIRRWYQKYGLTTLNWRVVPDDHLAVQLAFVERVLRNDEAEARDRLEETARFLDEHLLRWVGLFAEGVARRADTGFYAGLAILTWGYLEEYRGHVTALTGLARRRFDTDEGRDGARSSEDEEQVPYVPGAAPSW